ncbi:hypothetical protein QYM36_019340, partial [Artemia franciscana]
MGDNNRKQIAVDDAPTVCETLRREKDSKITQKIHSPTANVFSKGILPHRLRDKSHDLWLHQSVSFYSDSVCDNGVLPTTQNSGSNVEVHSIGTTESSDVIQEIRLQTEKLRDSTDQANLPRFVDTQETEAGVTYGTMQAAFGNSTLPNTPPKWFLEYMEAFKRDLFERSVARLDKLEVKLEKFVAILATNPVLAPNTEENTIKNTNLSKENQNFVGCGSNPYTDGVIELQEHPAQPKISQFSFPRIPADTVEFAATANPREHLDEPVVALELIQDTLAIEIPHVERQGTVESPISMDALQVHTDNILLKAAPECLNKATVATDDPLYGSREIPITQKIHLPTANVFSKGILPHRLRDKSHDLWLHQSVSFYSDSVGDNGVLPTTQNSGSNVEVHSIGTTESSDVIQEIRLQTEKRRDSTDQANLQRFVDTQETEAGVTSGTMQAAFGNSTLPNTPPKWFLEYMEA